MEAKLLSITHYDETGWNWYNERIEDPAWKQIEEGIRRMDRFRRPFVHLHLQDYAQFGELSPAVIRQ